MSARDEAIEVMADTLLINDQLGDALDAIPNDVLVRYAIERGALEGVEHDYQRWLYRVVE